MADSVELSIVVLCYRAEESIIPFVQELKQTAAALTDRWQLVLVGNYIHGSDDRTREVVRELAANDPRVKAIVRPKKGMMGWDMRKGLQAADGEYLCVIDGDGQFPIRAIERCYLLIKGSQLDMVKTHREKRTDGLYRLAISRAYNFLFRLLFPGLRTRDANSKPKMMTRSAYRRMDLHSNDWFVDAEIMINARRHKMRFEEFPIEFSEITIRRSFITFGTIVEFARNLVVYRFKEYYK